MKLKKALEIIKSMLISDTEFDAVVLEGGSGIGKTSAVVSTVSEIGAEMTALQYGKELTPEFRAKHYAEIAARTLFVPMGGGEDSTRFMGMPVPIEGCLKMLKPDEFNVVMDNNQIKRALVMDEINRVDTMTSNAVQSFLGASDRKARGINNVMVIATQNPCTDNFLGTSLQDEAFQLRTIKFTIEDPTLPDLIELAPERGWDESICDGLEYIVETDGKLKSVPAPRVLENISKFIKARIIEEELFQFAFPGDIKTAKVLYDSAKGALFQILTPEELYQAVTNGQTTKLIQIIASFRKAINRTMSPVEKGKLLDTLGKIMEKLPPSYMAAVHTRFSQRADVALAWAKNVDLVSKVQRAKAGAL